MALSYAVGRADLDLARAYQVGAARIQARHGGHDGRLRFQGHGIRYYMERYGVPRCTPSRSGPAIMIGGDRCEGAT
jgi:hypothetical protein